MKVLPTWRDAISKLAPARTVTPVLVERVDPSTLAARIGAHPQADRASASEARAPWRRALRTPPIS